MLGLLLLTYSLYACAYPIPMLGRDVFMSGLAYCTSAGVLDPKPLHTKQRVLVIGCGTLGHAIRDALSETHITAATTKPRRLLELQQSFDDAIVIPQLASVSDKDEVLREAIARSNVVVMADTIRMFSVHSFARTAFRVRNAVDANRNWKGSLVMVSTENAYGCVLGGEKLYEHAGIYPNIRSELNHSIIQWQVNPHAMAMTIRSAENEFLSGPQCGLVLRTCGLWDDNKFLNAALYTSGRKFPLCIKGSHMSFATIKTIAKAVAWGIKRKKHGIYNVCEKNTLGLTRGLFYEKIHELYGSRTTGGVVWDSKTEFDRDKLFCMDPDPFLPSSQRCNSQVSIAKIINEGF